MNHSNVYFAQELIVRNDGNQSVLDVSSASRYGTIQNVLKRQDRPSLAPGPALNAARKALANFNPDVDFICAAGGDPLALPITLLALRDLGFRKVQFLRWERSINLGGQRDKSAGFYTPTTIPLI